MLPEDATSWTLIAGAVDGTESARDEFVRRYTTPIRSYLRARWRTSRCLQELDDAVQEVFIECFREGGALAALERERQGGFRAFLYGVVRNVGRRIETRRARAREHQAPTGVDIDAIENDEETLSRAFDRGWAVSLLREAFQAQLEAAGERGDAALKRIELLRLRFTENVAIRDIASRWSVDAATVHDEYRQARREFRKALREVVSRHRLDSTADVDSECKRLIELVR